MSNESPSKTSEAQFARAVNEPLDEFERLQLGVDLVTHLVPGCDEAGVSILTRTGVDTDAASSELVWRGDLLQYELQEGPCLDSVATQGTVVSNDLLADRRWPTWGRRVADELGVHSMLAVLLYTGDGQIGALNLYAHRVDAYTADDLVIAESLAAHLAVAVAAGREIAQRGTAMVNRTVIGQAEGILMERYRIDAERAFQVLRRISQNSNRKLSQVAQDLVASGDLAELRGKDSAARGSAGPTGQAADPDSARRG